MRIFLPILFMFAVLNIQAQKLYEIPEKTQTRWSSFENPSGNTGIGGKENKGAKGHPSDIIDPNGKKNITRHQGCRDTNPDMDDCQ